MSRLTTPEVQHLGSFNTITEEEVRHLKSKIQQLIEHHCPTCSLPTPFQMGVLKQGNELYPTFTCKLVPPETKESVKPHFQVEISAEGTLVRLLKETPLDKAAIRAACILQAFPMPIGDLEIQLDGHRRAHLKNVPVPLRHVHSSPTSSHDPLCYTEEKKTPDKWLRMIKQDTPRYKAFIAARYTWGLNLQCCYFDIETHTVLAWSSDNYDYPEGVALRRTETEVELFLDKDESTREILYTSSTHPPSMCIEDFYPESGWKKIPFKRYFGHLHTFLTWVEETKQPDTVSYTGILTELYDNFMEAFNHMQFQKAIDLGTQFFAVPLHELQHGSLSGIPDVMTMHYNIACAETRLGKLDEAMVRLTSIAPTFTHWDHLQKDPDLSGLRSRVDFQTLVKKYSPGGNLIVKN